MQTLAPFTINLERLAFRFSAAPHNLFVNKSLKNNLHKEKTMRANEKIKATGFGRRATSGELQITPSL
ncbi:hypothetical protein CWB78_10525 [Pseudoalteromonas sp. S1612]|nr:hypothetical protein CWB78_10525 [Pseudoalteromonas sp. S1612]